MPKRGMDKNFDDRLLDLHEGLNPEHIRNAKLQICARAESVDEARILLDMAGLTDDQERFPSVGVNDRGQRGKPTPLDGPLLASGYGAVVSDG